MREIPAPHSEILELDADALIFGYRLAEAAGGDAFVDYGPDGANVAVTGSLPPAADLWTEASVGGREFNGSTSNYALTADNSYIADFQGECTFWATLRIDVVGTTDVVFGYGGTNDGTPAQNTVFSCGVSSVSGELFAAWGHGSGSVATATSSGLGIQAGDRVFAVWRKRADPDNAGKYVVDFDVLFPDDDDRHETDSVANLTNSDGTTSANIRFGIAAGLSSAVFDGVISDCGAARRYMSDDWVLDAYARQRRDYDLDTIYRSNQRRVRQKVLIKDSDGTWRDLTALDSGDHLKGCSISRSVNQPLASAEIALYRARGKWSLSPEMQGSPHNEDALGAYARLLDAKREVKIRISLSPRKNPRPWEYETRFHGFVSTVDWASNVVRVSARGRGMALRDQFIREVNVYGDPTPANAPMVDELQAIIDDNKPTSYEYLGGSTPQIYEPVASGVGLSEWKQRKDSVLNIRQIPAHIGFDLRYVWNNERAEETLTLYEPDRASVVVDRTLSPGEVRDWRKATIDDTDIRNACRVYYGDILDTDAIGEPVRKFEEVVDTDSVDRFGYLYCEINEATNSPIDSSAEAADFAQIVVDELSDPQIWGTATLSLSPFVELGDRYTFEADGLRFDTDTTAAVIGVRDILENSNLTTEVELWGTRPILQTREWVRMMVFPGGPPQGPTLTPETPTGLTLTPNPNGVYVQWNAPAGRRLRAWDTFEVHVGASGFTADSSSLVGITRGSAFHVADVDPAGGEKYVRVVARDKWGNRSTPTAQTGSTSFIPRYDFGNRPRFRVEAGADDSSYTASNWETVDIGSSGSDVEDYDVGDRYDFVTSYDFTAPVAGEYEFSVYVKFDTETVKASKTCGIRLQDDAGTPNVLAGPVLLDFTTNERAEMVGTFSVQLAANDVVRLAILDNGTTPTGYRTGSWWSGKLVGQD